MNRIKARCLQFKRLMVVIHIQTSDHSPNLGGTPIFIVKKPNMMAALNGQAVVLLINRRE